MQSVEKARICIYILYKHLTKHCLELQNINFGISYQANKETCITTRLSRYEKIYVQGQEKLDRQHKVFVLDLTQAHFGLDPKMPKQEFITEDAKPVK